jgi:hypothetical protein
MLSKQSGHIAFFSFLAITALIPSKVLGDNLAVGYAQAGCTIFGANRTISPVGNTASTTQTITTTSCDLSAGLSDGQSLLATGTALATLSEPGLSAGPTADAYGTASASGYNPKVTPNYPGAQASLTVESAVSFSTSINMFRSIPSNPVDGIPVQLTWTGETTGTGDWSAQIGAAIDGNGYSYSPGVLSYTAEPGEAFSSILMATCSADAIQNQTSECQAIADPVFTFDQATFNAEMGASTFPLDEYYDFEYSPNLAPAPTPEPSTLILLGTGLLGLANVARRKRRGLI